MLQHIKQRLGRDDEQGFTLIELMVVVLIIAILLAIAIPTFLGAKSSANARAAQSSLRNALTAEQTYFTNGQVFGAGTAQMSTIEPNLTWKATVVAVTDNANTIWTVTADTGSQVLLQAFGADKRCYSIWQNNDPSVVQTSNTAYNQGAAGTACLATPTSTTAAPLAVVAGSAASAATPANWYSAF